jgi:hypothetical protein
VDSSDPCTQTGRLEGGEVELARAIAVASAYPAVLLTEDCVWPDEAGVHGQEDESPSRTEHPSRLHHERLPRLYVRRDQNRDDRVERRIVEGKISCIALDELGAKGLGPRRRNPKLICGIVDLRRQP